MTTYRARKKSLSTNVISLENDTFVELVSVDSSSMKFKLSWNFDRSQWLKNKPQKITIKIQKDTKYARRSLGNFDKNTAETLQGDFSTVTEQQSKYTESVGNNFKDDGKKVDHLFKLMSDKNKKFSGFQKNDGDNSLGFWGNSNSIKSMPGSMLGGKISPINPFENTNRYTDSFTGKTMTVPDAKDENVGITMSFIQNEKLKEKLVGGNSLIKNFFSLDEKYIVLKELMMASNSEIYNFFNDNSHITYKTVETKRLNGLRSFPKESDISPKNNTEIINYYKVLPSMVFDDLDVNSTIDLYDSNVIKKYSEIELDYLRYFLYEIPRHPNEKNMPQYEVIGKKQTPTSYKFSTYIDIPITFKHSKLNVVLESRNNLETNEINELITKKIDCKPHYEAYVANTKFPQLIVKKDSKIKNQYNIFVKKEEADASGGFNIYVASMNQDGSMEDFSLLGSMSGNSHVQYQLSEKKLSVVRAVSVNLQGTESHLFSEVVIGEQYPHLGGLCILPHKAVGENVIKINIYGVPRKCQKLELYKRSCFKNNTGFELVQTINDPNLGSQKHQMIDVLNPGEIYEYYLMAYVKKQKKKISNYVFFKHPYYINTDIKLNIEVSNSKSLYNDLTDEIDYYFEIKSVIPEKENEKMTTYLKDFVNEIYEYFLSPANIQQSSVPKVNYKDILLHEIIRLNLNTGEKDVFPLMPDGSFVDDAISRKKCGAKPINIQHNYVYQVITYKRDPITLFKNYIFNGENNGIKWFYSGYKWLNPMVRMTGKLYADEIDPDTGAYLPAIDSYESMTSECYGMVGEVVFNGTADVLLVEEVLTDRIDRNTIKISWKTTSASNYKGNNFYNSFIVMKVVNGIRSILGASNKNFIYHDLTVKDVGSLYYIVVPITKEYDIDDPAYSDQLFVSHESLKK